MPLRQVLAKTLRLSAWASGAVLIAGLAFSVDRADEALTLPDLVVKGVDSSHLEAQRHDTILIDSVLPTPQLMQVEIPTWLRTEVKQHAIPKVQAPGCIYQNPITSALARIGNSPAAYYKSGLVELSEERLVKAAHYFNQVIVRNPGHHLAGSSYFWLAEIKRKEGRIPEALVAYRKVEGDYRYSAIYRYAWLAEIQGRSGEAIAMWLESSKDQANPHRAEGLLRLGRARYAEGNLEAARKRLEQAREVAYVQSDVHAAASYILALTYRGLNKLLEAQHILSALLLARPDHQSALPARLLLAWVLLERGEGEQAKQRFQSFLESSPPAELAVRAHFGLVRHAVERKNETSALGEIERISHTSTGTAVSGPWHGWAWLELATMYFDEGRIDSALDAYRTALSVWGGGDTGPVRYMEGECLHRLGRYTEAAHTLALVDEQSPVAPAAWKHAGVSALIAGDAKGALLQLEAVVRKYPDFDELDSVWAWIGEARLRLEMTQGALQAFEAVSQESPAYAKALYLTAWIAFEREQWDEAAKLFARHLSNFPDDPNHDEAALTLARSHYNQKSTTAAIAVLEELEEKTTSSEIADAARYNKGWMQLRFGVVENAWKNLTELIERAPDGPYTHKAHFALGWSYFGEERYSEAMQHFQAVLKLNRGSDEQSEAARKLADSLFNLGRYEEALYAYRKLGETPEASWGVTLTLGRLGRTKELVAQVKRFESANPNDQLTSDLLLIAARALEEAGDNSGAADLFERAAMKMEGSSADHTRLMTAINLAKAGRENKALLLLQELAKVGGITGRSALSELGELYERRGEDEKALTQYELLGERQTDPASRVAAYRRGAYFGGRAGKWERAAQLIDRALPLLKGDSLLTAELTLKKGELLLAGGFAPEAAELLEELTLDGASNFNLRARELKGRALESSGRIEEALETYIRVGYLYPLDNEVAAAATLRAADIMRDGDQLVEARALYAKLVKQAKPPWSGQAELRLEALPTP